MFTSMNVIQLYLKFVSVSSLSFSYVWIKKLYFHIFSPYEVGLPLRLEQGQYFAGFPAT